MNSGYSVVNAGYLSATSSSASNPVIGSTTVNNRAFILVIIFLVMMIIFLIIIVVILAVRDSAPTTPCGFSTFGVMPNFDNVALSTCGSNKSSPCVFQVNSVSDAISQCEDLNCKTFSFNESTSTMKIINLQGAYGNVLADIYSRN